MSVKRPLLLNVSQSRKKQKIEMPKQRTIRRRTRRAPLRKRPATMRRPRRVFKRSRRPAYGRTGSNSLVKLIRDVATSTMEPKRHLVKITNQGLENNVIQTFPLTRVTLNNAQGTAVLNTSGIAGNNLYMKGIRVKGYVRNGSQLPAWVNVWVVKSNHKDGTDLASSGSCSNDTLFYNPETGTENAYATIPKLFQQSPSLSPKANIKCIKKIRLKLSPNKRGEGATAGAGETLMSDDGDTNDIRHFSMYLPFNKTVKKKVESVAEGTLIRLQEDIALWFMAEPYAQDLEFTATFVPQVTFTSIMYFKDA